LLDSLNGFIQAILRQRKFGDFAKAYRCRSVARSS
jgi:hypothetical protein